MVADSFWPHLLPPSASAPPSDPGGTTPAAARSRRLSFDSQMGLGRPPRRGPSLQAALRLLANAYVLHLMHQTSGGRVAAAAASKLGLDAAGALAFHRCGWRQRKVLARNGPTRVCAVLCSDAGDTWLEPSKCSAHGCTVPWAPAPAPCCCPALPCPATRPCNMLAPATCAPLRPSPQGVPVPARGG